MTDHDAPDHDGPTSRSTTEGDPSAASTPGPDEEELLAFFDRLRPQGSARWAFDDAMRRVDQPDLASAAEALPWRGLPDDLWERGRAARIGQRFVGDVARVMANLLAADTRDVADAAVASVNGDRFVATRDALQYLASRIDALEARVDPLGLEAAEWPVPPPDQTAWVDVAASWFADVDRRIPVVVGESGDGALVDTLRRDGRAVRGVEPRGASVWRSFGASVSGDVPGSGGKRADGPGPANAGRAPDFVFDNVVRHLRSTPDRSVAGVVLIGCVDRTDLAGKLELLEQAIRVTVSGGTLAVLTVEQSAWDASLSNPARDLARGRPFHPETWSLMLRRTGVADPTWHRPESGDVHAVVATVER